MKLITLSLASLLVFAAVAATQENPESNPPRLTAANLFEMEELAEKGADPNAPIGYARMLREGEDPSTVPGTYFPLDAAIDSGQANLVKRILALGAKPRGNELADIAFLSHGKTSVEIAEMLFEAGVDPNHPDGRVYGPALHAAASRGNLDLLKLLLAQPGINVDLLDIDGRTALMPAAKAGHFDIVQALVEAGADPDIKNARGLTAADEAREEIERRQEIVSHLDRKVAAR